MLQTEQTLRGWKAWLCRCGGDSRLFTVKSSDKSTFIMQKVTNCALNLSRRGATNFSTWSSSFVQSFCHIFKVAAPPSKHTHAYTPECILGNVQRRLIPLAAFKVKQSMQHA